MKTATDADRRARRQRLIAGWAEHPLPLRQPRLVEQPCQGVTAPARRDLRSCTHLPNCRIDRGGFRPARNTHPLLTLRALDRLPSILVRNIQGLATLASNANRHLGNQSSFRTKILTPSILFTGLRGNNACEEKGCTLEGWFLARKLLPELSISRIMPFWRRDPIVSP